MLRKNNLTMFGVVLLGLFLLLPGHLIGARDDASTRISPALQQELSAAGPNDIVTALVRMKETGPSAREQATHQVVRVQLRRNARDSQMNLVSFLNQSSRVRKTRQFWIDNLVLVKAPKDVIQQIAARSDVIEVFENFTVSLPPKEDSSIQRAPATQVPQWDPLGLIGARTVWSSYGLTGSGVRVGGLDTGVDISHPDISGKMITNDASDPTYPGGWGEFDADGNIIPGSVPHDSDEHGTHTTGTMVGGNASGYDIGVAPDASLLHGLVIPGGSGTFAQVAGGAFCAHQQRSGRKGPSDADPRRSRDRGMRDTKEMSRFVRGYAHDVAAESSGGSGAEFLSRIKKHVGVDDLSRPHPTSLEIREFGEGSG